MSSAQPSDEEMRAALEQELRRISVDEMLLQSVVSLVNLAARRAGLAGGGEDERDPVQVHTAIEAVRALMPLLERGDFADRVGPIRDALSQLQIAYARMAAAGPAAPEAGRAGTAAGSGGQGAGGPGAPGGAGAPEGPGAQGGPDRPGGPGTPGGTPPRKPGGQGERAPGPAESSGRLWVPGR